MCVCVCLYIYIYIYIYIYVINLYAFFFENVTKNIKSMTRRLKFSYISILTNAEVIHQHRGLTGFLIRLCIDVYDVT